MSRPATNTHSRAISHSVPFHRIRANTITVHYECPLDLRLIRTPNPPQGCLSSDCVMHHRRLRPIITTVRTRRELALSSSPKAKLRRASPKPPRRLQRSTIQSYFRERLHRHDFFLCHALAPSPDPQYQPSIVCASTARPSRELKMPEVLRRRQPQALDAVHLQ